MNGAIEELGKIAEALVYEQREEEKRLAAVIEGKSLRIRRSEVLQTKRVAHHWT